MAHILLSRTYKSNNFSQLTLICTIHTQHGQFGVKKSVLSTGKIVFIALFPEGEKKEIILIAQLN
ncbi:hypothetical protein D5F51_14690 [Yersinia hibernica]|uniref:Uncharacterized protein n=2 Tax=Yersinia TaxID=629 RepID=A0ABX5R238_9GAMM|nr:hypothetical protein LC20_08600 [Yersinia hibernica]OVZ92467.1 hypothetical protein CBW54_03930 [Yersinia kristensenii]QAX79692.1 hypothetical protein D5F51_14690 [Yersinia hibernica]